MTELCYKIINYCQISYVKQIYGTELNKYVNYTFSVPCIMIRLLQGKPTNAHTLLGIQECCNK